MQTEQSPAWWDATQLPWEACALLQGSIRGTRMSVECQLAVIFQPMDGRVRVGHLPVWCLGAILVQQCSLWRNPLHTLRYLFVVLIFLVWFGWWSIPVMLLLWISFKLFLFTQLSFYCQLLLLLISSFSVYDSSLLSSSTQRRHFVVQTYCHEDILLLPVLAFLNCRCQALFRYGSCLSKPRCVSFSVTLMTLSGTKTATTGRS